MAVSPNPAGFFEDVVEEHFDELDFLFGQRSEALDSLDYRLADLAELEQRMEAHIDGAHLAGELGLRMARQRLGVEDAWMATAAASVLCWCSEDGVRVVVDAIGSVGAVPRDRIRVALRHARLGNARDALETLVAEGDAQSRVVAADVLAFHRLLLCDVRSLLATRDESLLTLVYGILGRTGAASDPTILRDALRHPARSVRAAALSASANAGCSQFSTLVKAAALGVTAPDPAAIHVVGWIASGEDLGRLIDMASSSELAADVCVAIGDLGNVGAVPWLLDRIEEQGELTSAAGIAFTQITGQRVSPTTRSEWKRLESKFARDRRWQWGAEFSDVGLSARLDELPLRVRRHVYLGARARGGDAAARIEFEAPALRQRTWPA